MGATKAGWVESLGRELARVERGTITGLESRLGVVRHSRITAHFDAKDLAESRKRGARNAALSRAATLKESQMRGAHKTNKMQAARPLPPLFTEDLEEGGE